MKPCVIIVDDDDAVRDSLSALLECEGFRVQTFCSGRHFLGAAPQRDVHCLIVDMHMPGMSGLQIANCLKRDNRNIPIILITGNLGTALKIQAEKCGITIMLEKPFQNGALLDAVSNCQNHR